MKTRLLLLAALAHLAGCNTVGGIGRDVTGSAHTVQNWMGG